MLWSRSHTHHFSTQLTSQIWWPGFTRQPSGKMLPCALKAEDRVFGEHHNITICFIVVVIIKNYNKNISCGREHHRCLFAYLFFCNITPILFRSLSFPLTPHSHRASGEHDWHSQHQGEPDLSRGTAISQAGDWFRKEHIEFRSMASK